MTTYNNLTKDAVAASLTAAGFTVEPTLRGFSVKRSDVKIASLSFLYNGEMKLEAQSGAERDTVYKINHGQINMRTLLRRLDRLEALALEAKARHEKYVAREKSDAIVLSTVTDKTFGDDDAYDNVYFGENENVRVSVFNGRVTVNCGDLSPDDARKVLAVLGFVK